MFITYDAKDPNWTIWGCDYDEDGSVLNAWKAIRYYNPYDGSDREPYEPRFVTIPCSRELFDMVQYCPVVLADSPSDSATEDLSWIIKYGIAEYVDNPLKELRQLLLTQNRS